MAATWSWKESVDMSVISCSPSPFGREGWQGMLQCLDRSRPAAARRSRCLCDASQREIAQTVVPAAISKHEIDNGGVQAHPWSRTSFCRRLEG